MNGNFESILEAIKTYSETRPDKLCLGDKKNHVTYKQLFTMLKYGASYLKKAGVG